MKANDSSPASKNAATAVIENESESKRNTATIFELFSTADVFDCLHMLNGLIGSIVTGLSLPFICVLFGKMIDALHDDPSKFKKSVAQVK